MSYMMVNKLVLTIRIESSLVKTFKGELIKVHLYLYDYKDTHNHLDYLEYPHNQYHFHSHTFKTLKTKSLEDSSLNLIFIQLTI